jgi:tetratricopeptide (TPR) repeat protein
LSSSDGASAAERTEAAGSPGTRFQIRRVIGRGAMGVVSEALDCDTGMLVALKTIQTPTPHALYRLKREFRLVQDLQHENLVSLGELVEHKGSWFFTMELLDGVDFFTYVRPGTAANQNAPEYDERRLRDALAQLLSGLDALHTRDFVHRDVKPNNVLVTTEGRTVLLDFGLATMAAESMQSMGDKVVGTAHYMAPEQAAGRTVSSKSDMYAVGVMLYEALTGRPPFDGNLVHLLLLKQSEVTIRPSQLASVPADLEALCMELLSVDPEQRPSASRALSRLGVDPRQSRSMSVSQLLTDTGSICGREAQWEKLHAALARAHQEGARALLVRGEPGLGKSTLVQAFLREVTHEGEEEDQSLVLTGRCYEREHTPYRGFDACVDELARHLCNLPASTLAQILPRDVYVLTRLFPVLGRVPAIARAQSYDDEGGDDQHRRTRAFESLRALLNQLSQNAPLLIFIDDVQWADGDGITLLRDLMHGDDAPRVLWLLAARSGPVHEAAEAPLTRLRAALGNRLEEVELERLDREASLTLTRELLQRVAPRSIGAADSIVREAEGYPLHMAELVQYTAMAGWNMAAPPRLDDAIWARTSELPPDAARLLTALCVAGAPLSPELIARGSGLPARACTRLVSMLRIAQLARWTPQGRVEPFHERVRDAVLQRLSSAELHDLHTQLVDALETELDRPELLVYHLRALGDAVRTAKRARQAAERAMGALAFDRAATLYRTALEAGAANEAEARELRLALARALMNMGQCAAAADEFLRAADGADPETRLEAQRLAAQQLLVSGHMERGLDVASMLLAELGLSMPKTPRAAMMSLLYHRFRLWVRGMNWQERRAGQITREQINRVEVLRAVGQGLALVDNVRGADFNARFLLDTLALGDRERIAQAVGSEATYRGSQGKKGLTHARKLAHTLMELCEQREEPYYKAWAIAVSGSLDHFDGLFERAERRQRQAIELFRSSTLGFTWELNTSIIFRFFAMRHMGAISLMRGEFERELREAERRGDRHIETSLRRYCICLWLARGDTAGAAENLDASLWSPPEGRFHMQHWYELDSRCELDIYRGSVPATVDDVLARFVPLDQSLLLRVQFVRELSMWVRARCLLAPGFADEGRRRLRIVERTARGMMKSGLVPAEAWAGLLLGAVHAARGHSEQSVAALQRSIEIADERCMHHVAASGRIRLGEVIGGDAGRELVEQGKRAMIAQGITEPMRYAVVVAPGFDSRL